MKLRKVLLVMDASFGAREASRFDFQARSLGHYVGRHVAALRLDTPYAQLVVAAHHGDQPLVERYFPQSLLVRTTFDVNAYRDVARAYDDVRRNAYFSALFSGALPALASVDGHVASACAVALESFVQGGHENAWTHASIRISKIAKVSLRCRIDTTSFVASFVVEAKDGERLGESVAFRTEPDELMFHAKLGKLQRLPGKVTLSDRHGGTVASIDVARYSTE